MQWVRELTLQAAHRLLGCSHSLKTIIPMKPGTLPEMCHVWNKSCAYYLYTARHSSSSQIQRQAPAFQMSGNDSPSVQTHRITHLCCSTYCPLVSLIPTKMISS